MNNFGPLSKVVTLALMTIICVNCEKSNVSTSASVGDQPVAGIINGRDATAKMVATGGLANSTVGIFILTDKVKGSGALCSGTLIAKDMILTAGHCMTGATADQVNIYFQATDLDPSAKAATIKSFVINPGYVADESDSKDDVAILRLSETAPSTMTPSELAPSSVDIVKVGKVTFGFGQADDRHNTPGGRDGSAVLRYTLVSDETEVVPSTAEEGNHAGMIATDSSLTGTCHGDSGGPLFAMDNATHKLLLAGVTESGFPVYQGQQGTDFDAMLKALFADTTKPPTADQQKAAFDGFYTKYPDAHICSGIDYYVNIVNVATWINQAMASLSAQP